MAVVVTAASGYDLGYIWKNQGEAGRSGRLAATTSTPRRRVSRRAGGGGRRGGARVAEGQVVERRPYELVYRQIDPRTGEKLGRSRGGYATFADHLARLQAAEPHATAERLVELEREAAQATRRAPVYTDVTVSFSKSISVFHASIRENERRARLAGDRGRGGGWAGREQRYQEVLQAANRAGAGVRPAVGRGDPDRVSRRAGGRAGAGPVRGGAADGVVVAAGDQPGRGSAGSHP